MSITNSSQISIRGRNTFNHVHGDQVNQTISGGVIHVHGRVTQAVERTMPDEFEYVKRGHIVGVEDLGSVDLSQSDCYWQDEELFGRLRKFARISVSTVNVHPDRQSKFTVFEYEGKDAHEAWKDDFRQFSRVGRTGLFKLFGINQSEIPMLIFHHELIPAAHFYPESLWMNMYIRRSAKGKMYGWHHLWLNTSNGALCKGPAGPAPFTVLFSDEPVIQDIPSTLKLLEEKSTLRFFSQSGPCIDLYLLTCAWRFYDFMFLDDLTPNIIRNNRAEDEALLKSTAYYSHVEGLWRHPPRHFPIDISDRLRFDTVYSPLMEPVARRPEGHKLWKVTNIFGLTNETRLDGGLTRFEFTGWGRGVLVMIELNKENLWRSWLSQSSCMFDALEVTEHRERFFMVCPPVIWLQSIQDEYDAYEGPFGPPDPLEEIPVVYLFLYPPPMTVSELIHSASGHTHFWSFDENGQSKIPREEWTRWYLPALIPRTAYGTSTRLCTWPTHIYTALRDWQIARGFAPSTSDWARSMGYPEFEVIGAGKKKGRFEEHSEAVEPQPKVVQDEPNSKTVKKQFESEVLQGFGWLQNTWIILSVQLVCIICLLFSLID